MTQTIAYSPTQQVFEWVLARPVAPPGLQHGRLIHVQWSAPQQDGRVVQVYVDGELNSAGASPMAREAWLLVDAATPHRIELLAVDPGDAATPAPASLLAGEASLNAVAGVAMLRDLSLPIDARVSVDVDDGPPESVPLFGVDTPRGGFGAVFGEGGFGYDASIGPGLGRGELGYGPLGVDGDALRWRHATLSPGGHTVRVALNDAGGDPLAPDLVLGPLITALPEPPITVTLGPDLTLTWN